MITLGNLFKKFNINLTLSQKLDTFKTYIDEEKCQYHTETHEGDKVHVFEGPLTEIKENLTILYNEDKEELVFIGNEHYNVYDKDGNHTGMS